MSDKTTMRDRLTALLDWLIALLWRWRFGDGWDYLPVHESDRPVAVVPMSAPEYQALMLLGYSGPEDQEPDWSLEPAYDMPDEAIAAMRLEAIEAMRAVIRRRVAEWDGEDDE